MADDPTTEPAPSTTLDPAATTEPNAAPPSDEEEFDKARAMDTIRKQRESEAAAKKRAAELEAKVREYEDRDKTETERLAERAKGAESSLAEAQQEVMRLRVALRRGLTETQAKRLVGDSEEDLEKDADELLASFRAEEEPAAEPRRRPREDLRPGAVPNAEPDDAEPGLGRLMRAYAQQ